MSLDYPFKCPECGKMLWPVGESGVGGSPQDRYWFERYKCTRCGKEFYYFSSRDFKGYVSKEQLNELIGKLSRKNMETNTLLDYLEG